MNLKTQLKTYVNLNPLKMEKFWCTFRLPLYWTE